MINTPLDAPVDFIPAADERPAGAWMEGYWANIALWSQRLAYGIWAYFGIMTYNYITTHTAILVLFMIPYLIIGYFFYTLGQNLKQALQMKDQRLLEKGFRQLQQGLVLALVIAVFGLWSAFGEWTNTFKIISDHTIPSENYEIPIQSE